MHQTSFWRSYPASFVCLAATLRSPAVSACAELYHMRFQVFKGVPNPPIRWRDRRVDPIWGESTGNLGRSNIPSLCFGGGGCDSCTRQDPAEVFRTRRGDTPTWGFQKVACKSADNCAILAQAGSGRQRQQLQTLPVGSSPLGQGRQPQDQLAGVMHQPSRRVEDQEAQALGARGH